MSFFRLFKFILRQQISFLIFYVNKKVRAILALLSLVLPSVFSRKIGGGKITRGWNYFTLFSGNTQVGLVLILCVQD